MSLSEQQLLHLNPVNVYRALMIRWVAGGLELKCKTGVGDNCHWIYMNDYWLIICLLIHCLYVLYHYHLLCTLPPRRASCNTRLYSFVLIDKCTSWCREIPPEQVADDDCLGGICASWWQKNATSASCRGGQVREGKSNQMCKMLAVCLLDLGATLRHPLQWQWDLYYFRLLRYITTCTDCIHVLCRDLGKYPSG